MGCSSTVTEAPVAKPVGCSARKTWLRRTDPDTSQRLRHAVQAGFLLLNVWIGVQFYLFVRFFELGGVGQPPIARPPGVEGWLPIAGMMNTSYFIQTGRIPAVHAAAMVLFVTFLAVSLLFRKSFCGWLCPIGTISEQLWKAGRDLFGRVFALPRWLDIPLRGLKYVLLALFVWFAAAMPAASIAGFLGSPYGMIADVRMLGFFRHVTTTTAWVLGVLVAGSFFIPNFWCRYLCPYGALMGIAALGSPLRIRRVPELCIDCAKCQRACPSQLPVDRLVQIRSAECLGCLECVAACPAEGALFLGAGKRSRRAIRPAAFAAGILGLFLAAVGLAMAAGVWQSTVPGHVYERLIPVASDLGHP